VFSPTPTALLGRSRTDACGAFAQLQPEEFVQFFAHLDIRAITGSTFPIDASPENE
jgi:hypothetical protein